MSEIVKRSTAALITTLSDDADDEDSIFGIDEDQFLKNMFAASEDEESADSSQDADEEVAEEFVPVEEYPDSAEQDDDGDDDIDIDSLFG